MYSKDNLYPVLYHGEHLPNPASKVTLTEKRDRLGRGMLAIDLVVEDLPAAGGYVAP